jgi:hypothetical protein
MNMLGRECVDCNEEMDGRDASFVDRMLWLMILNGLIMHISVPIYQKCISRKNIHKWEIDFRTIKHDEC